MTTALYNLESSCGVMGQHIFHSSASSVLSFFTYFAGGHVIKHYPCVELYGQWVQAW